MSACHAGLVCGTVLVKSDLCLPIDTSVSNTVGTWGIVWREKIYLNLRLGLYPRLPVGHCGQCKSNGKKLADLIQMNFASHQVCQLVCKDTRAPPNEVRGLKV